MAAEGSEEVYSSAGYFNSTDYLLNFSMEEPLPYHQRPEAYVVPIVFSVIFVVGIVGNVTLVIMFTRNKSLRSVPNTYIISLALGDLLVLLFTVPFVSFIYVLESWPFGVVICKCSEFVREVSVGVTVFTLTALSADRYMAIVSPLPKSGSRVTVWIAFSIWLLAMVLAVPVAIFSDVDVFSKHPMIFNDTYLNSTVFNDTAMNETYLNDTLAFDAFQVCTPYPMARGELFPKINVIAKFLIYYAIPLFAIATFYLLMSRHLILSAHSMPGKGVQKQMQTRRKVAKVVLCFVLIFAVCFLPIHIFLLWFYFHPTSLYDYNAFWHVFRIVGFCLSFLNSCINPLALYFVSGTFRLYYNEYLFCCCDHSDKFSDRLTSQRMEGSRGNYTNPRASLTLMVTPLIRQPSNSTISTIATMLPRTNSSEVLLMKSKPVTDSSPRDARNACGRNSIS